MSKKGYKKLKSAVGVYKHETSGNFLVRKKINGKFHQRTFSSLYSAKNWQKNYDGKTIQEEKSLGYSTLNEVWNVMQKEHFPTLATSTKEIWRRRYRPWKKMEHLSMDKITPSRITKWVNELVEHYRSDFYQDSGRGQSGRCNLNNELNLFVAS